MTEWLLWGAYAAFVAAAITLPAVLRRRRPVKARLSGSPEPAGQPPLLFPSGRSVTEPGWQTHTIAYDLDGNVSYLVDGERWPFPPGSFLNVQVRSDAVERQTYAQPGRG